MTVLEGFAGSKTVDLYAGIIEILVAQGLGRWSETEELPEGDVPAISIGMLGTTAIRAIGVNLYTLNTDVEPGVDKMGVTFRIRTPESNPLEGVRIADKLEDVFHGQEHSIFRTWHIPAIWRHSLADLGPNENDHYQFTDTYHFYVDIYREGN